MSYKDDLFYQKFPREWLYFLKEESKKHMTNKYFQTMEYLMKKDILIQVTNL